MTIHDYVFISMSSLTIYGGLYRLLTDLKESVFWMDREFEWKISLKEINLSA